MKLPASIKIDICETPDKKIEFSIDAPGIDKNTLINLLALSEKFLMEEQIREIDIKYPTLEMD